MATTLTLDITDSQQAGITHYFDIAQAQRTEENRILAEEEPTGTPLPALVFDDYASARIGGCLDVWEEEANTAATAALELDKKYKAATPEEQSKVEDWSDQQPDVA
jgi:hypothetical protein